MPADELAWDRLETTGLGVGSITFALTFAGAYLVIGSDEDGLFHVARSTDGRHWAATPLGSMVQPCGGWVPRPDSSVYAAASDGMQVVLAGIEFAKNTSPCDSQHAVAWVSADGLSWQRSTGFGAVDGFGLATAVWAIPEGWEALAHGGLGATESIWSSSDGLEWRGPRVVAPGSLDGVSLAVGAATDGTRILSLFNEQIGSEGRIGGLLAGESRLQSSVDGIHWANVGPVLPTGRGVPSGGIIAPSSAGPAMWLLVTVADEEPPITYVSTDLRSWEQAPFPRDRIRGLVVSRYGYIVTGSTPCPPGSGGSCRPDPIQYLSTDGLAWTPFTSSVDAAVIVDGPAGVLAISYRGFEVWRLRP